MRNICFLYIGTHITCKANGKGNKFVEGNVQDCKFPFIKDGKRHIGCAPGSDGKGPFCATKVDAKGNYQKDNWARCNKHCNTDEGGFKFQVFILISVKPSLFSFFCIRRYICDM